MSEPQEASDQVKVGVTLSPEDSQTLRQIAEKEGFWNPGGAAGWVLRIALDRVRRAGSGEAWLRSLQAAERPIVMPPVLEDFAGASPANVVRLADWKPKK